MYSIRASPMHTLPGPMTSRSCRLLSLLALMTFVLVTPQPAHSQTEDTSTATPQPFEAPIDPVLTSLNGSPDLIQLYDLSWMNASQRAAIYEDPQRRMNVNDILNRFARGDRPRSVLQNAITVRDRANPFWIVLPILNQSGTEHWILDFGDRMHGRAAYYTGLFFYEHTSRKVLINALPDQSGNPLLLPDSSNLPLVLPLRKPIVLVMLLQPDGVSAPLLPLTIRPDLSDAAGDHRFWQNPTLHLGLMALVAGFFLAAGFLSQRWGPSMITLYLVSLGFTSLLSPHTMFIPAGSLAPVISVMGPLLQNALLLITLWLIFRGSGAQMGNPILFIAGIALQVIGMALVFFYPPLLPSVPPLASIMISSAPIICVMLCIRQARLGDLSAMHLMVVTFIQLFAELLTFASENAYGLTPSPITLNAVLLSLLPQALFFGAALRAMSLGMGAYTKTSIHRRSPGDEERMAKLRQAKEGFDYNNLLKVIEHERRQLSEAREREGQRTEEMRRAKEAADEANRAKSAFLAVISHEIRTPMTGVMGMVKMLQDTTLTKDQTEFVSTIKESGNAMMSLLNDILDFEKIESGKMQLESIDFDLHRLITGVATLMNGHATTKGITLRIEMDPSVPQYVIGDVSRLRQVLLNLVGNGIKFTKQGGVTIRLSSTLQTGATSKNHQIYFAVIDSGIGISREAQKNIFNPFAQADATIARKFGGSGLGLAISKRLIEAMGSQINISSKENEGTTFFFTLNMREGNPDLVEDTPIASVGISSVPPTSQKHMKILVVEDNEITQRVLKALLEQHGHQPTPAESGEDAIEMLRAGMAFDLILSDIQMNGMSGLDLARQVRMLPNKGQANTPIVALTGNVDQTDIERCYEAGMNDHLAKPIDPDKFNEVLRAAETGNFRNTVITHHPIDFQPTIEQAYETLRSGPALSPAHNTDEDDLQQAEDFRADNGGFDSFAFALNQAPTAPAEMDPATPTFQTDMLDTLKESLGTEQLTDMLEGLFSKAEEIITVLSITPEPYNLEDVRARAHELKGMCGNFGLMALSRIAAELEKQAKNGIEDDISGLIQKLQPAYATGRMAIDEWLKA